ncbi:hypothetical protein KR093_000545, partial [Drosophila rubida]
PGLTSVTVHHPIAVGSFGVMYAACLNKTQRAVALKQVLLDPLNREVDILNRLKGHCNIVQLHMNLVVYLGEKEDRYSLLALEPMPMSLLEYICEQQQRYMPQIYVRIVAYQLFRGLAFVHSHGICHSDVNPENLQIDPLTMNLRLSNFSSAIFLGQPQVSPRSNSGTSRLYRAPELFGDCAFYSTAVDIWSAGCVLAEIISGKPLFEQFSNDAEQLLQFVLVLGTFGLDEAVRMKEASGISEVIIETRANWQLLLNTEVPSDLQQLLNQCLVYDAGARIPPLVACAHGAFDELRTMELQRSRMPNGAALPPLFNFSEHEM